MKKWQSKKKTSKVSFSIYFLQSFLLDAETATFRIQELRRQEFEFRLLQLEVQYYQEHEELEKLSLFEQQEAQKAWKSRIDEIVELSNTVKQNLISAHKDELKKFDKESELIPISKPKFSREYLTEQSLLNGLIRTKRYSEAEALTNKIKAMEIQETEKWNQQHKDKILKKRKLVIHRQKVELEALQERLEINLQEKVLQRDQEIEKLVHRLINVKNELEHKQNQEISKLTLLYKKNKKLGKDVESYLKSLNHMSMNITTTERRI